MHAKAVQIDNAEYVMPSHRHHAAGVVLDAGGTGRLG